VLLLNDSERAFTASPFQTVMQQVAQDQTILLTGVNAGFLLLLKSFRCRLDELGISNHVVAALDRSTAVFCNRWNIPWFAAESINGTMFPFVSSSATAISTLQFLQVTQLKSSQLVRLLRAGYDVLLCDLDVFFLQHPMPLVRELCDPAADVCAASDRRTDTPLAAHTATLGLMFVRSNHRTISAFTELSVRADADARFSDHHFINALLCGAQHEFFNDKMAQNGGCVDPSRNLRTIFYPSDLFFNGHSWSWRMTHPQRGELQLGIQTPVAVHYNWNSGLLAKTQQLRASGFWALDLRGRCRARGLYRT